MGAREEFQALLVAQETLVKIIETIGPSDLSSAIEMACANLAASALDEMNVLLGVVKQQAPLTLQPGERVTVRILPPKEA